MAAEGSSKDERSRTDIRSTEQPNTEQPNTDQPNTDQRSIDQRSQHDRAVAASRIVLRPLGSALPLGLFGFAAGALMTAFWDLHWVPKTDYKALAIGLLTFVMPLEGLACIFGFLSRDAAGGTAMGLFAASWAVFGPFWLAVGAQQSPTLGVFALLMTVAIACLAVVAWGGKPLLTVVLTVSAVRDGFLSAYQFGATPALAGVGWCGLLLAPLAVYCGFAFLMEDVNQRTLLPLFRRGNAKRSMEGSLADQLQRIEAEAGVRNQL